MKKLKFLLLVIILSFLLVGCDDEEYLETSENTESYEEESAEGAEIEEDERAASGKAVENAEVESGDTDDANTEKTDTDETDANDSDAKDFDTDDAKDIEATNIDEEDVLEETETAADESYPVGTGPNISFNTVDVNGNPVGQDLLKSSKLVMLNLWEPWCGPCVNEMPELNELYIDYKDKGLLIIGAYETFEMDADAKEIVDAFGIAYPIIKVNKSISKIEQDYVPATYLLDRDGNIITVEPFAGSNSYSGWEEVIRQYLE